MAGRLLTVLQVLPDLQGGGVERGTLEIAGELVRRGHRSLVISGGGRLVAPLEQAGSGHITWPIGQKSPWTASYVFRLRALLLRERVDILHVRSRVPAWVAWLAWKSLPLAVRPRLITTVHGFYSVGRFSSIMAQGEAVIAVSQSIADYVRTNYPSTDPAKLTVVPRGIDPQDFPRGLVPTEDWLNRWTTEFPETRGRLWLTLAGRITRLKGHDDFLKLVAALKNQGHNIHGLIVGGEDPRRAGYAHELRQQVAELGLTECLTLTGHRSDIREIYAASRAILSLSTQPESFGRTVLEALAIGTPVIGYDHGGVGEILRELYPTGAIPLGEIEQLISRVSQQLSCDRLLVPAFSQYRLADSLAVEVDLYERMARSHTEQESGFQTSPNSQSH